MFGFMICDLRCVMWSSVLLGYSVRQSLEGLGWLVIISLIYARPLYAEVGNVRAESCSLIVGMCLWILWYRSGDMGCCRI